MNKFQRQNFNHVFHIIFNQLQIEIRLIMHFLNLFDDIYIYIEDRKTLMKILDNNIKIMRFAGFFRVQIHSWNANVS